MEKVEVINVFSTTLKKYRNEVGISQEELAAKCNLDRTYISMLERGRKNPTITTLFMICESLNIKPSELVSETEKIFFP